MPIQDTLFARRSLYELTGNPANTLRTKNVTVLPPLPGNDTFQAQLYFGAMNNDIVIANNAIGAAAVGHRDAVVSCAGLISPMRRAGTVGRLNQTARVALGGNQLWVTDNQNGCSVMILDWGGGLYSMVHLQPHTDQEFNWLGKQLNRFDFSKSVYKNAWLRPEMTTVTRATSNVNPQSYILVQSLHVARQGRTVQVFGVNSNGGWRFFMQQPFFLGPGNYRYDTTELEWTRWQDYVPFQRY